MSPYVFPGYPRFLELAEAELGLNRSAGPAGRIRALTELANLCAQASRADLAHVDGILSKAVEFRDQIATALRAAELMMAGVEAGRRPPERIEVESEVRAVLPLETRSGQKRPRNERVPS